MIPLRLEIEGFYSYKEKQIINFKELTAAGLFGIFGHVGSGKSSILEAILLSLYGSTERLADKGEKGSMLNLESEQVKIHFEFLAGKNNETRYLSKYSAKRKPKSPEEIKSAEHQLYLIEGEKTIPLDTNAEQIIGMKKEHFNKTVIIPQGKFSEFLKLSPGPRADMMKELFGLEKYDLSQKTITLLKKVYSEKEKISAQVNLYENHTLEDFETKKEDLEALDKTVIDQKNELDQLQNQAEKLSKTEQLYTQYKAYKSKFEALSLDIPQKQTLKKQLEKHIKCKLEIQPLIENLRQAKKEVEVSKHIVLTNEIELENLEITIGELVAVEQKILSQEANRPEKVAKIRDLEYVIHIINHQEELKRIQNNLDEIKKSLLIKTNELDTARKTILSLENEKDNLQIPNISDYSNLKSAGNNWLSQKNRIEKINNRIDQLAKDRDLLTDKINSLTINLPDSFKNLEEFKDVLEKQLAELELEKEILTQKQGLLAYTHLLHSDHECPLCGSTEHPDPLTHLPDNNLEELMSKIINCKKDIQSITENISGLRMETQNLKNIDENIAELHKDLHELQIEFEFNSKILATQNIHNTEDLDVYLANTDQLLEKKENLENQLVFQRKKYENLSSKSQELQNEMTKLSQQEASVKSKVETYQSSIQFQEFSNQYLLKPIEAIKSDIEKVKNSLLGLEENLKKAQSNLQDKRNLKSSISGQNDLLNDQIINWEAKVKTADAKLSDKLEETTYTLEEVKESLSHEMDEIKIKKEIEEFENEIHFLKTSIADLEKNPEVLSFDIQMYHDLNFNLEGRKLAFEELKKSLTLLEKEIEEYQKSLLKKEELSHIINVLENRLLKIKELDNLFKGSGFVKYVSNIYLRELCQTANLRFQKLTKNQLSMEVDEQNTFWVVDYLNSGKRRLLKSLSGGQTFQASLCLALALAEKVKSLNRADKSFFFLDEGFGALDKNSLRLVFETLKSLRQENRIVGIISHVEELQQEIGVYATVALDPEKGSQIKYSFEKY